MQYLHALPYYGGKSAHRHKLGRWVASLLPRADVYIEAYSGMCGVLLQRSPSRREIINDLDKRIITWWRVIRDRPEELKQWLRYTPYARESHAEACEALQEPDKHNELAIAGYVTVALSQSMLPTLDREESNYRPNGLKDVSRWHVSKYRNFINNRLNLLSARMANVELESKDACWIVERWCNTPNALIYLDPPYVEGGDRYGVTSSQDAMLEILTNNHLAAKIAISGYKSCVWSQLEDYGFVSNELKVTASMPLASRTEVLWTNYETYTQYTLDLGEV